MNGALLIHKAQDISSFGVIEVLKRGLREQGISTKTLKIGHGGTLDPFATGLMVVLVGKASKLAQYFLGSNKGYTGTIRFGETTIPGDPTAPVSETSEVLPSSLTQLQDLAQKLTKQSYLQVPPMFSAKKYQGKPLYELARKGIEIERKPKECQLFDFQIHDYQNARSTFTVRCSSGTYIRTLAQDFSRLLGTVGLLERLERISSGSFQLESAWTLDQVLQAMTEKATWSDLDCWIPFDLLLDSFPRVEATSSEAQDLRHGKQNVIFRLTRKLPLDNEGAPLFAIYEGHRLLGVAKKQDNLWSIDKVFISS